MIPYPQVFGSISVHSIEEDTGRCGRLEDVLTLRLRALFYLDNGFFLNQNWMLGAIGDGHGSSTVQTHGADDLWMPLDRW